MSKRALFYSRLGYSLASLPFAFLGYATSIYHLWIVNVPLLHNIFPSFLDFLKIAGIMIIVLCGLLGYIFMKRSWLFREQQQVQAESDPFMAYKVTPVTVPFWEAHVKHFKAHGIDTSEIEKIIERSKK